MSEEMKNFPAPSGTADQIAAKAIECLDRDIWHELTNDFITIRSVMFYLNDVTFKITDTDVSVLKWGAPSAPYQQAFRESYNKAMARKREKLMQPKLKAISNEKFGVTPRWVRGLQVGGSLAGVVLMWFLGAAALSGISSCSEQERLASVANAARERQAAETQAAARAEQDRLDAIAEAERVRQADALENAVNKYGFKRSVLLDHKVWPDDCADGRYVNKGETTVHAFKTTTECKEIWEKWEKRGEIWVDWKDAP